MQSLLRLALAGLALVAGCQSRGSPAPPASGSPVLSNRVPAPPDAANPEPFVPTAFGVVTIGEGRPIIFIPGLGCRGRVWYDVAFRFENHQIITLTAAGFGGVPPMASPEPAKSVDRQLARAMRDQLAAYIRDRKIDRPVIVGHSMGGFVALWLAATEPDLVGPIVLVDSSPGNDATSAARGKRLRDSWVAMSKPQLEAALRSYYGGMFTKPADRDRVLEDVLASDQRTLADAIQEVFTVDLTPELPKVTAPVLAVLADGQHQHRIRQQLAPLPRHQVVVLPNTRHFVMVDDPTGFHAAVASFLTAHPRP